MKIKMTDQDRGLVAAALQAVPWTGGPEGVLQRYQLGRALGLDKLSDGKLSKNVGSVELSPELVTLMGNLVAGGNGSIAGSIGPIVGEFLTRVRRQIPAPSAVNNDEKKVRK